jgi:hypothetical protein
MTGKIAILRKEDGQDCPSSMSFQQCRHDLRMGDFCIRETCGTTFMQDSKFPVIDAECMQERGVKIMNSNHIMN